MPKSNPTGQLPRRLASWRSTAVGLALLGGLMQFALACSPAPPAVVQPIAFDHHRHTAGKDGIQCTTCHTSVDKETFAGLPQVDACMNCHAIVMRMSPAKLARKPGLAQLKQFVPVGWIPWGRVYREPDYVFFSHRRHVTVAKLECATCHGDMRQLSAPPVRPAMEQTMNWCVNCHEQRRASTDCISCHK